MQSGRATAAELAPLVFELTRAIRARHLHPAGHPVAEAALQRCESAGRDVGAASHEFTLGLADAGLVLDGGARVTGPGADELAVEMRARRVQQLRFRGEPSAAELAALVDALAREPEALAREGGVDAVLRACGARRVEAVTRESDREGAASREQSGLLAQHIAALVRRLSELESCDDLASYNLTANKIEASVDVLVRAKRSLEAYRAMLVFARHATDPRARSDAIRREAGDRLGRLAHKEELLGAVVEQACGSSGLASVQASQVLIAVGGAAVTHLLRSLETRKDASRARVTQLLIALGDAAIAQVVDELASAQPERARRAARLLGEMQNPKGVCFLADALAGPDPSLAREAALSLARIGDDAALQALLSGLRGSDEVAEACAACLGGLRRPAALQALYEVIDERRGRSENVRRAAIQALGRIGNPAAIRSLREVLDRAPFFGASRVRDLRVAAAQAIAQIGGAAAFQALRAHESRGDPSVSRACREALRRLSGESAART